MQSGNEVTDAAHPCDDPPGECQAHADGEELCPLGVCRRDPGYTAERAQELSAWLAFEPYGNRKQGDCGPRSA